MYTRAPSFRKTIAIFGASAAMLVAFGGAARGQQSAPGFAVDCFEPAAPGSDWFTLESLDFRGHGRPAFGLVLDGAWKPLVVVDQNGNAVGSLVSDQIVAHAGAAIHLWDRVRLDFNAPIFIHQGGTATVAGGLAYPAPGGAGIGDLRAGADVRLFGHPGGPVTSALGAQLFLPTGKTSTFSDDGRWRVWPHLLLAGSVQHFSWAARLGYHFRPKNGGETAIAPGDEVTAAAAAGYWVTSRVLIGPELDASSATAHLAKAVATPAELLLGVHVAISPGWMLAMGVGPGLTNGEGSPTLRGVAGLQYSPPLPAPPAPVPPAPPPRREPPRPKPVIPPPPPPPPPDQDGDGIVDSADACPTEAGNPSEDPTKNGCPPPKDADGDGIVDPDDACPAFAGPRNDDPTRNGCPVVRVENGQIRIREQVKFKTASSQILKESDYILEAVFKVLVEHPEISKVRVEGHTDTVGKPGYNKKLSNRRAASVVKWLVKHGISRTRMTSEGWGQERPLATNKTVEGRRQNRRVEFHIVEGPGAESAAPQ